MDVNKVAVATYEKIAQTYSDHYFSDLTDAQHLEVLAKVLPENAHLLDVGCGPGQFSQYFARRGVNVMGIDLSTEMIKIAREKVAEAQFAVMDMSHLEFPDQNFEALLAAYSLIHIPSEKISDVLDEFFRVLKLGGYLLVIAQQGDNDQLIDEPFLPSEKMFFNFFTPERLKKFLEQAGFSVKKIYSVASQDPDSVSDRIIVALATK